MRWRKRVAKKETISKILKLKDNKKKELELEVKEAHDRVDEEKAKLMSLEKDYNDTHDIFSTHNKDGSIGIDKINSYYDYFARITVKIKQQKEEHLKKQQELALIKKAFINAHKDKKVFEIMKDKAVKKEIKERIQSEQKEADFFMLSRKLR